MVDKIWEKYQELIDENEIELCSAELHLSFTPEEQEKVLAILQNDRKSIEYKVEDKKVTVQTLDSLDSVGEALTFYLERLRIEAFHPYWEITNKSRNYAKRCRFFKINIFIKKFQGNDRYIDAFGKGLITEKKLRSLSEELRDRKLDLETKKLEYKQILNNRPTISPLKLAENMVKLFKEKLSFEDKQKIVRVVVEKVVTTPLEATIYGRIPIFEGIDSSLIAVNENEEKVGFESKDCDLQNLNQHITTESSETECRTLKNFTSGKVGFELKDRNCGLAECGQIDFV